MSSLLRLEGKQKMYSNAFRICIFYSVVPIHMGLKRLIRSYSPLAQSKTIPDSRPKWESLHPYSDQNGPKSIPFVAAQIYMAYIREYHSPCPGRARKAYMKYSQTSLYGHPLYTDTSLLRTVCFVPGERKPLHFL